MMPAGEHPTVECVTCGKKLAASDTHLFEKLEFFDDVCYCKECLTSERQGFRPAPAA
jgi:hypothetical protein